MTVKRALRSLSIYVLGLGILVPIEGFLIGHFYMKFFEPVWAATKSYPPPQCFMNLLKLASAIHYRDNAFDNVTHWMMIGFELWAAQAIITLVLHRMRSASSAA